ncbi:MAG: hypothetical protein ACOCYG_04985, partial [Spirochaetota bacterium]
GCSKDGAGGTPSVGYAPGPELELKGTESPAEVTNPAMSRLIERLNEFLAVSSLPRLREYGIDEALVDKIAAGTGPKNHPVEVSRKDVRDMLMERL